MGILALMVKCILESSEKDVLSNSRIGQQEIICVVFFKKNWEEPLQKQQEVLPESALAHCVEGLQISN